MKSAAFVFLVLTVSGFAETNPVSRDEVLGRLRGYLLDVHGGTSTLPDYADELERERGFPRIQLEDMLLQIADDESWSGFARDNAVVGFIRIAKPDHLNRLDRFYASTNQSIRASILCFMMESLETVPEKLAYARTRWDWLAEHPESQRDAMWISIGFLHVLHSQHRRPSDLDRRLILDFFLNAATNAAFFESAHEAEMLLLRYDPAWPTNEARRAMMEKWKDDPGIHEKTRALWVEALAAFDGTNAAGLAMAGSSASSETDKSWMAGPDTSDPLDSIPALSDGAPVVPDESSKPIREPASSPFHLARIAGTTALLAALMAAIFFQRKIHRETKSKDRNYTECRE